MVLWPAGLVVPLSYIIAYIGLHATNAISMKQFETKSFFLQKKYSKAEYTADGIWHSRHDFSTCVTLKVNMAHCSGQGQAE